MLNEKMKFMRKQNVIYFIYIGLIQVVTCIDITIKGSKQYYVAGEPFNFTCRFNSTANAVRALQKDNVQVQSVQLAAGVCYNVQPTVPVICTASFCSCSQQGDIFTASWTFPISSTNTWKCVEGARQSPEVTLISAVPCSITVTQTPDTAIIGNAITLTCVTNECRPTASIQWLIGNTNYTRNSTVTVTYSADNLTKVESKLILIATTDLIDKIVSCRAWDIDNTVDVIKNFTLNIQGSAGPTTEPPENTSPPPDPCGCQVLSCVGENGFCVLWIIIIIVVVVVVLVIFIVWIVCRRRRKQKKKKTERKTKQTKKTILN